MSGNNAIIVDETADLKLAIPAMCLVLSVQRGNVATTTRRLFIHESIYEKVTDALVSAYKKVSVGDPLDQKNLMVL